MSGYKSDFLNVLAERGFIHQVSEPDALDQFAQSQAITAYIGFDCTAASLHIGSLLPIMIFTGSAVSRNWVLEMGQGDLAMAASYHGRRGLLTLLVLGTASFRSS